MDDRKSNQYLNLASFHFQRPQVCLCFITDPVALNRFLDGFVMRPLLQTLFLNVRQSRVVLFYQSRGEIPGDHHVDIVLFRSDTCHKLKHLRPEIVVKIKAHQHFDGEAHNVGPA